MSRACEHDTTECTGCFKERIGSVQLSASSTASRKISRRGEGRPKDKPVNNGWERGRAVNSSRNMPYLDASGNPVPVKKFAETRRQWRDQNTTINVD